MFALSVLFGAVVGFALGLTGGGGSIFAIPLLVYGLGIEPQQAVGVSLAAVGTTALLGSLHRLRGGEVEVGIGLLFSAAGMAGAPIGAWLGSLLSGRVLMLLFAALMAAVAVRMWRHAAAEAKAMNAPEQAQTSPNRRMPRAMCDRDESGHVCWSWRCGVGLALLGLVTGVLAGLFGVGGGFVIVPALVLISGIAIHRAVATSLIVVALISGAGVLAFIRDRELPIDITLLFVLGGVLGLAAGTRLGRKLSGPRLQQVFAVVIVALAAFVTVRNLV